MKNLLSNIKEWMKQHKVASTFIIIALVFVAFVIDEGENEKQEEQNKKEVSQSEDNKKEAKSEKKESETKKGDSETEKLETKADETKDDIEEIKKPKAKGLSPEFKDNASSYFIQLSSSYSTLGDLTDSETESEMMTVIKSAQAEYDQTKQYYTALDPQSNKEKAVFDKISKVDGLAARALMNAETGLNTQDTELIDLAAEDIEESSVVMDDIMDDIE